MADVFISYKREDRPFVKTLARAMQQSGFTVWWDSRIEAGENWMACIKRALNSASTVVILWSPQSVRSDGIYVSEVVAAEAEDGRVRDILLPVRIMNSSRPWPHNLRNEVDLSEWQGNIDDPSFARLAGRIASIVGKKTTPAPDEMTAWLTAEEANNADAYRAFLERFPESRFAAEVENRAAEIELREADLNLSIQTATRIIEQFAEEVRKPVFVPPLDFTKVENQEQRPTALACGTLFDRLKEGGRFVLSAAPGGGKTVTLLEWASAYCDLDRDRVGTFLRLKEFAKNDDDLFEHLARLEGNGHISAEAWKALACSGVLTLFCDGWNELTDADREKVGPLIDIHARTYPSSGIVIGTRPIAPPPFSGSHVLLSLQRLNFAQVKVIIQDRLGETASDAIVELRQSQVLRDLVRTPFFLSAFCETRGAGVRPTSREGLVSGLINTLEQLPQHGGPIRAVFNAQQGRFLTALAVKMLESAEPDLDVDVAMRVVNQTSDELRAQRILDPSPPASDVLNTLRDHHCIIEATGNRPSYRFQHQLIEEWYASSEVRLVALLALANEEARRVLDVQILDDREWTEAVLFAVETPNENEEETNAIAHLILRAIGIEPEFAARLISTAPPEVWRKIAPAVRGFVDSWRKDSGQRVMQFALHSGREEFSDIVWEAIKAEKPGRVPDALESHFIPRPAVLGTQWRQECSALTDAQRADLLGMLLSSRTLEGANMALEAALVDNNPNVKKEVAEDLSFYGFDDELQQLLEAAPAETWNGLVQRRIVDIIWEEPWREKALEAAQRVLEQMEPGPVRISFALYLQPFGLEFDFDVVAELLECKFETGHDRTPLYEAVAELEGERLSEALIERVLKGQRVTYRATRFIREDTEVDQAKLIEASLNEGRYGYHEILSRFLDAVSLDNLLGELHEALRKLRTAETASRKNISDRYHRILDTLIHADKNVLAETILELQPSCADEIGEISEVIMRAYRIEPRGDDRAPLKDALRDQIIQRLAGWAQQLLDDPDCNRHALNRLAEAIATFPSTSLLTPLRNLLHKELEIWKSEKQEFEAALATGRRPNPDSGARMGYAFRYGQNLLSMAQDRNADFAANDEEEMAPQSSEMTNAVIDVLSEFLRDPLFGEEAARVLATLRLDPVYSVAKARRFARYDVRIVDQRRRERLQRGEQPIDPIAEKLLEVIKELCSSNDEAAWKRAAKLCLAAMRMNCGDRYEEVIRPIIEIGSVAEISQYLMLSMLGGHEVDAALAEECLDKLDARIEERSWEYFERWFQWQELLVLMIVGGKPLEAAQRLLTYDRNTRGHDERQIIEALGVCRHRDSLAALQLLEQRCKEQRLQREWFMAVCEIGSPDAANALLTALLERQQPRGTFEKRDLYGKLAALCNDNQRFYERVLDIAKNGDQNNVQGISGIVRNLNQESLLIGFLDLPADRLQQLGGPLADALKELCLDYRPVGNGTYEIEANLIPEIRSRLFARSISKDPASAVCTWLLQVIDGWRERYGDSFDEPRHPNIETGQPWPATAKVAWDASMDLVEWE